MDMKIEKWQVENGIAKPVNPYKEHNDKSKFAIVKKSEIGLYAHFVQHYGDIKYATDAPPGIHSAEMFGEVVWQYNDGAEWRNELSEEERLYSISVGINHRQFLPFKHPVEPNDKQPMEKEYWCCADCEMSFDKSELGYKDECPICGDICEIVLIDCHVQPLNPNANAIKIIEQYKADLKAEWNESGNPFKPDYYNNKIYALNHILKLLQS